MARIGELLAAGPTFSFEFFPPSTDSAQLTLGRTIAELESLRPSFVSVTYGAGGSTRQRTRDVVTWVARETGITPMAHLTCQSHTRAEIAEIIEGYRDAGIENLLALGGDAPLDLADVQPSDYRYASELVDDIASNGAFSIGVAAHPEGHPRSPDLDTDRRHLADKLRRSHFAITQFFFEAHHWTNLRDDMAARGVEAPIIPGIMPITNLSQIERMATLSGAEVPSWLVRRLEGLDAAEDVRRVGVELATELCTELLAEGAPGLHFYTLNRSSATREIYTNLGLSVA
jgi:methylenetetrahydrofolate reductase (NADPH)